MKAGIIYKIDDQIDCDRTNIREQLEEILDDPNNFEFKEYTDDESMFSLIHHILGKPTVGVTACNLFETIDTIYAGYFIDITESIDHNSMKDDTEEKIKENINDIYKNIKLNILGSQLSSQHVTSNLVVVKKKLSYIVNENNVKTETTHDTLTRTELIDVFENIFVKNGVAINPNGSMSTYKYIMNPMEHLILSDPKYAENYIYHEYEIYTHIMMLIVDTREIHGKINKIGSFLAGRPVNGTVFVAIYKKPDYNENPPYIGLSVHQLINIISLRQRSAGLTTGMSVSEKEYVNFDKLIELENIKHKNMPLLTIGEIKGESLNLNISDL